MAIKLIGVPGRKILEAEATAGTHDFILIDGPVFFVRDTESCARLFKDLALRPQGAEPGEVARRAETLPSGWTSRSRKTTRTA